jgi:hypothetical protein
MLLWCCLVLPGAAQDAGSDLETALALFSGDDIMIPYSDEGRVELEAAIAAFRTALHVSDDLNENSEDAVNAFEVDPAQKDLVNKLSQCYYTLADAFLTGESDERATYLKGKHWGLKSLRMNPEFARLEQEEGFVAAVEAETDIAALYWAAANWLRASEFNKLEAIFAGVPEKSEAMSFRCLELDETYMNYGSYRALGAFWGGMPRLPAGTYRKNFNNALCYFCKVVDEPVLCAEREDCPMDVGSFDPAANEYFENRMFFVEFYLMEKELWEDAARIIKDVLAEPIGEKYPLYNAISQEKAQGFLEEVNKHL